jgi:predicted aconitase with swiveling domain
MLNASGNFGSPTANAITVTGAITGNTVTGNTVVLPGSTSGSVSLVAPAVAGTTTATLPAATGTVMVSGNMPAFSAYLSSSQTVTSGTWTKVAANTKEFDTASCYDNSTNYRFTPNVAGYYQVNGGISSASSATGIIVNLYKTSR